MPWASAVEAVILAAGFGRGLEPVTHTRPKPLVPVLDRSLLEVHLDALREVGTVKKVVVVANYLIDKVREKVLNIQGRYPFELRVVDEGRPLGTAHALLKGLEAVDDDEVLVIYVDSIYATRDLLGIATSSSPYLVAAFKVDDPRDYGVLICDPLGFVKDIVEKPSQLISNVVNAGVYKFRADVVKYLEKVEPSPRGEYELTDAARLLSRCGAPVRSFELRYWRDIGRVWKYLEYSVEVLGEQVRGQTILGRVEEGARISGPVYVGEGAEILSGTYIVGPAYIGRGAVIGPNAYIRPGSIILDNSRIGFSVEVKESVIMEQVHASHLSYIGDSIVCEDVNLGAGTILANLRLDEKEVKVRIKGVKVSTGRRKLGGLVGGHAKTGVNVSVNPGVKLGAYSRVFPGLTIYEDIPPCHVVRSDGSTSPLPKEGCPIDTTIWS